MTRLPSLALASFAALCLGTGLARSGGAAAAAPVQDNPLERLVKLEKQVADLKAQVAKLEAPKPSSAPGDISPEVVEVRKQMADVISYLNAQADSARSLQESLADSEVKGFTWGINPDSRIVMLAGFNQFVTTLQTSVPGQSPAPQNGTNGNGDR